VGEGEREGEPSKLFTVLTVASARRRLDEFLAGFAGAAAY
jgi:hypothetical protein